MVHNEHDIVTVGPSVTVPGMVVETNYTQAERIARAPGSLF